MAFLYIVFCTLILSTLPFLALYTPSHTPSHFTHHTHPHTTHITTYPHTITPHTTHPHTSHTLTGRDQDPETVDSQNDAGYTALHHAAKHGSKELIEILVKAGADRLIENNAGETPYMVARKFEQLEAERLLLNVEQQHGEWV